MPINRLDKLNKPAENNQEDGELVGDDVTIELQEMNGQQNFMDTFFKDIEEIRGMIGEIESHIEDVKTKYSVIVSTPRPDETTKQQIDDIMALVKRNGNRIKSKLKIVEQNLDEDQNDRFNADYRIRRIQHSALMKKFVEVMTEYNKIQTNHQEKCKKIIQRQLKISGKDLEDGEIDEMLEQGNVSLFTDGILSDTQQAKQNLADIEERHADIIKLERSIKDLHDMFIDMALLVSNQGVMIDNIERNVESSTDYVATAKDQVKQARSYQWKALKKKVCIIVFLVLLLIFILLLIF